MPAAEIFNPRDCLKFEAPFRSLMTACEVNGEAGNDGVAAFEIDSRHMLRWLERHGLDEARTVNVFLGQMMGQLQERPNGTVWSDEFDFNHRWPVAEASVYFESWSRELIRAMEQFDAKSIVFLSLLQRARETALLGRNLLGDYYLVPVTEREFAFLEAGDAIEDDGKWICISDKKRKGAAPCALLWWVSFFCGNCRRPLKVAIDPDEANDLWKLNCCGAEIWAESIRTLAQKWLGTLQKHGSFTQNDA